MEGGGEREALAGIADRLCAEFGSPRIDQGEAPTSSELASARLFDFSLTADDEQLVATARHSLTRIAAALEGRRAAGVPETAVPTLLDGAEMVMRSELAKGNRPSALMPSFVFLVTLPLIDHDEALEWSNRTAALLEEAMA